MKKLAKAGKQKGADDILPWIKSVCSLCSEPVRRKSTSTEGIVAFCPSPYHQ